MSEEAADKKGFNWNWVALGILIIAYIFSAGRFLILSAQNESTEDKKIVRVVHWQLEPGYREALEWAMDKYNNLPHVKEAGVQVVQIPLPTRVYNQFMNVHLISGTAPDIAAAGFTSMISGNAIARFYASLGDYVNEPNPYNAEEFLSKELDPKLREYLANEPWKETFLDGMEGGWKPELNDYYSVPISNLGGLRFYYNMTLVKQGKTFIREAIKQSPQPAWLQQCWLREVDGETYGYLPDNQRLRDWLASDDIPQTLGQLILFCYAIQAMAEEENITHLVPISVGNVTGGDPIFGYQGGFLYQLRDNLDHDGTAGISGLEAVDGLKRGVWSFDDHAMLAFVDFAKTMVQFYPAGYQGLDREQIQRRFVSGDAALFSSGSWDAAGVFKGVEGLDNPEDRFEVRIARGPMPAPDERWGDLLNYKWSEANFKTGVPLSINKQSKNFEWSLDFLQYLSSQPVNEEFNKVAAWLPAIVGSETTDTMRPFEPIIEGFPGTDAIDPTGARMRSNIRNEWLKNFNQVVIGEMEYEAFADNMLTYLDRSHKGLAGYWYQDLIAAKDKTRALDRNISVEEFIMATENSEKAAARFRSLYLQSLEGDEGVNLELMWRKFHPDEPYPNLD